MLSWPTSPVARPGRPRFQPKTRRTVSVFHVKPSDQPFKMRARLQFSQRRMWLRDIVRTWRRFTVLQIEIRLHAKAMAVVSVASVVLVPASLSDIALCSSTALSASTQSLVVSCANAWRETQQR
jgi:hypothetical protein